MNSLTLHDLFSKTQLNINDILLVRHSINDKNCKWHYENNKMYEYMICQNITFPTKYKYFMTFISGQGTTAVLDKFYEVISYSNTNNFTQEYKQSYQYYKTAIGNSSPHIFFELQEVDLFAQYENKLIIDWGLGTIKWYQSATNDKEILAIHPKKQLIFWDTKM